MGIKRRSQAVKATTRVSFGDRQLIRKLWIADKNSRAAKNKRTREISKEDTLQLVAAPHRRALDAYGKWLKKVRCGAPSFEFKDDDDRVAVRAMCSAQWSTLVSRHARIAELSTSLRRARPSSNDSASRALLDRMTTLLVHDCTRDVPLLTGRKHSRATNYRRKRERREALFSAAPDVGAKRRKKSSHSATSSSSNSAIVAFFKERNVCQPIPRGDYEDGDPTVFYVCHVCTEPVCGAEMHVTTSGEHDAHFYHVRCAPDESHAP